MKKWITAFIVLAVLCSLTACGGMSISDDKYNDISNYVLEELDDFSPKKEVEFFEYIASGGVYYGYYYTESNEIMIPDIYGGSDMAKMNGNRYEADGGTYFGKPNNGTDWCFVKKITDQWYYYELHWA